jgi:hypothetical protein
MCIMHELIQSLSMYAYVYTFVQRLHYVYMYIYAYICVKYKYGHIGMQPSWETVMTEIPLKNAIFTVFFSLFYNIDRIHGQSGHMSGLNGLLHVTG